MDLESLLIGEVGVVVLAFLDQEAHVVRQRLDRLVILLRRMAPTSFRGGLIIRCKRHFVRQRLDRLVILMPA